jgi:hypothetical protein
MHEREERAASPAARLDRMDGKTVALIDISKPGGSLFLNRMEQILRDRHGVASIVRVATPTFAKPAPEEVMAAIRHVDAVVEALAD